MSGLTVAILVAIILAQAVVIALLVEQKRALVDDYERFLAHVSADLMAARRSLARSVGHPSVGDLDERRARRG